MTGHLIGITGIPGTGKSYMARSCAEVGETAVAVCDPKEMEFYAALFGLQKLQGGPIDKFAVFADLDWRPHMNSYRATAFTGLLAWMAAREKDDSQFIVVDPLSEVSDFAMHEVLKLHNTADPSALSHGRAYTTHDQLLKQLLNEARRLVVKGKTVVFTFHGKMKEMEGAGDATKSKGMSGDMEWSFDEQMLPVLNTSMRQSIHSPFDLWLYTKPTGFGPGRKFWVTALPDNVRPAKHSVRFKQGTNAALIPNTMQALLEAIE